MNKIMLSIRPEWAEKIVTGEKTIECRKSKPNIDPPFTCYIYCTKGKTLYRSRVDKKTRLTQHANKSVQHHIVMNGKVIGEFICDKLVWCVSHPSIFAGRPLFHIKALSDACMGQDEAETYSGGRDLVGWHISDLKIYNEPKSLSEYGITRGPQSWRYV